MTTTAMRAAVFTDAQRLRVVSLALPEPGPHDIRIRLEGCGVCASNVPVWEGRPWFAYPLAPGAPGHEAWGHVTALGDEVTGVGVGDRVAFLCDDALASSVDVPAQLVVVLPEQVRGPFPGEALGCAFNIAARSGFTAGQTVAVVGAGFLGTLVGAIAADAGARVIAISRREFSLDVARSFGAKETVRYDDQWRVVEE